MPKRLNSNLSGNGKPFDSRASLRPSPAEMRQPFPSIGAAFGAVFESSGEALVVD